MTLVSTVSGLKSSSSSSQYEKSYTTLMSLVVVFGIIIVALLVVIAAGVIHYKRRATATDGNQKEIGMQNMGNTNYASLTGKEPSTYTSLTPEGRDAGILSHNAGQLYESIEEVQNNMDAQTRSSERNTDESAV